MTNFAIPHRIVTNASEFAANVDYRVESEKKIGVMITDGKSAKYKKIKSMINDVVAKVLQTYEVDHSYMVTQVKQNAFRNVYMLERNADLTAFLAGNFKVNHNIINVAVTLMNFANAKITTFDDADLDCCLSKDKSCDLKDKTREKLIKRHDVSLAKGTLGVQPQITIESFIAHNIVEQTGKKTYRIADNDHAKRFLAMMNERFAK